MALYQVGQGNEDAAQQLVNSFMQAAAFFNELYRREQQAEMGEFQAATELYVRSGGEMTPDMYQRMFPRLSRKLPFESFKTSLDVAAKMARALTEQQIEQAKATTTAEQARAAAEQARAAYFDLESLKTETEIRNIVPAKTLEVLQNSLKELHEGLRRAISGGDTEAATMAAAKLQVMSSAIGLITQFTRDVGGQAAGNREATSAAKDTTESLMKIVDIVNKAVEGGTIDDKVAQTLVNATLTGAIITSAEKGSFALGAVKKMYEKDPDTAKLLAMNLANIAVVQHGDPAKAQVILESVGFGRQDAAAYINNVISRVGQQQEDVRKQMGEYLNAVGKMFGQVSGSNKVTADVANMYIRGINRTMEAIANITFSVPKVGEGGKLVREFEEKRIGEATSLVPKLEGGVPTTSVSFGFDLGAAQQGQAGAPSQMTALQPWVPPESEPEAKPGKSTAYGIGEFLRRVAVGAATVPQRVGASLGETGARFMAGLLGKPEPTPEEIAGAREKGAAGTTFLQSLLPVGGGAATGVSSFQLFRELEEERRRRQLAGGMAGR